MKKITYLLAVVFSFGFNLFVKAQCPASVTLVAMDVSTYTAGGSTTIPNGSSYACNATPFYIWPNEPAIPSTGSPNIANYIFTPCVKTDYNLYYTTERTRGTETFYEGGTNLGCVGPGGCQFPIGGTSPPVSGAATWDLFLSYLDPSQQHDFVFSKTSGTWNTTTVTLQDCWTNATIASNVATPVSWSGTAAGSFTATIAPGTSIGTCSFSIAPNVAGALTDFGFGYAYVDPSVLTTGTYTITYGFSTSVCAGKTTTFVFSITNPYTATWSAPASMCSNASCVNLTTTGTAGGTWSGTGVSGSQFCPSTSGAGTFPVTYSVGISTACGASQNHNITVTATPTMNITGAGSICSGQSITLNGSSATNYTWSPSGGNGSSATVSPTSNTTYTLVGANGTCTASATAAVNVTATPTVNITGAGSICSGQSITLNGGTATNYTWSPSGGNGSSATVSPTSNTTYTLVGANGTCTASATAAVNVTTTPTVNITGAGTICDGQSITLTGGTATNYTWSPSGGNASSATVTPTSSTTYTLVGSNGTCTASATAAVNVTPNPTVTINSSGGASLCSGTSTTLTAGGATNYTWSPNAGGGSTNPVTVSPSATDTYTVTGESSGCTSTQVVTVNVTATPTISISASAPTICAGQAATFTASGATTYTWSSGGTASTETVTPGSTATYTVTGDNSGCTSTQVVTVNVNPLPTVTISATPASLCTGQTTTLTASGANTYTWSANAGGGSTNPVSVTPGATDTYTVVATDNNGCMNANTITVNVGAGVAVGITAVNDTICSGQSLTLNGSGATSYTWSPGGQTTPSITVTPTSSTTYTLVGDNGGCTGTQTFTLGVTATPTVTTSANTLALCSGASTTITGGGATNYTWMPGGANTSTLSVNPSSTTSYTLTGESGGCVSTSAITVSVTATPTVTASAGGGTICAGQSVVLNGGGATTYTWMPGGMNTGTVTVSPSANTTYTLTGANGSCTATATSVVNVTQLPNVTASSSAGNAVCSGASTTLTANGATTYTWMPGGANTATISVTPGSSTTYTVTGTSSGCDNAAQVAVTVNPTPTVGISASSGTICSGQSTTLNGSGATNYTWMPGGSNSASNSVNPTTSTVYTVTGETGGCSATTTVAVAVNQSPSLSGTPTLDSALCGMPTGGVHGIAVSGGTPNYTYQWYNTLGAISGATTATLTNAPAGNYTVVVTDANGCVANSGVATFTVPGSSAVIASITPVLSQGQAPLNVSFTNNTVGAAGYAWNLGNGSASTAQNPSATYSAPGTYTVTMLASNGSCWDTAMAYVVVDEPTSITIPNVFSPNGDGINDEFFIKNTGLSSLTCYIFNRWGQKMFTITAPQGVWDGTTPNGEKASEGTYYYILQAMGYDGKAHNSQGSVTLVK